MTKMLTRVTRSDETWSTTVAREGGGETKLDLTRLEPEVLLERVVKLFQLSRRRVGRSRVELYHRAALRRRVRAGEADGHLVIESGRDEGLAVRLVDAQGRIGFASVSDMGEEAIDWALTEARRCPLADVDRREPWAAGQGEVKEDLELPVELPPPETLARWLRRAVARMEIDPSSGGRFATGRSWVEYGCTVESIVADGGLRACRARTRAWAMTHQRTREGETEEERPRLLAARRLEDLLEQDWGPVEPLPDGPPLSLDEVAKLPFVLDPLAASVLVKALVRALFTYGHGTVQVGAGLDVSDVPGHPLGLAGGGFDDAGFPARRKRLADGRRVLHRIEGRGHLRRPSFRDPPRPHTTTLVVRDGREALPPRAVRISDLRPHPLGPGKWILEIRGALLEKGVAVRPLPVSFVQVSPAELAGRCSGAVGRGRLCPNNTLTPSLLIEGLAHA